MKHIKKFEDFVYENNLNEANTKNFYVDIMLSYEDKNYSEGETEKAVANGIDAGLKKNKWTIDQDDIDDIFDYQTNSTAVQFTVTVPSNVKEKDIIKALSLEDLSVNIDPA